VLLACCLLVFAWFGVSGWLSGIWAPSPPGVLSADSLAASPSEEPTSRIAFDQGSNDLVVSASSFHTLTFVNPQGKEAVLDFSGDRIKYGGELSVDSSAKIFFEALQENRMYFCPVQEVVKGVCP
jgi:hypothetical protein